jgi:hypothetical protein
MAASGTLKASWVSPFRVSSSTSSSGIVSSTATATRRATRICPSFASAQRRATRLQTRRLLCTRAVSKTSLAERCIALRDAGVEPEHAASAAPGDSQCSRCLAHGNRHLNRALGGIGARQRVVENTNDPAAGKLASVPSNWLTSDPKAPLVLTPEVQDLLRLGGLGECRGPAQIAKQDDDLAAMAPRAGYQSVTEVPPWSGGLSAVTEMEVCVPSRSRAGRADSRSRTGHA